MMFGLSMGLGSGQHAGGASVCDCDQGRRGGAFDLHIGWHGPKLAIFAALGGEGQQLKPRTTQLFGNSKSLDAQSIALAARRWVTRRVYVEGSAGVAHVEVPPTFCESGVDAPPGGCDPEFESDGMVIGGAVGAELASLRWFALSLRARAGVGMYSDLRLYTMTLGLGLDFFR